MVSNTCVAKIEERSINVKKFGTQRNRISLILCLSANGLKLPPLIIFKGQTQGRIESLLSKYTYVKNKKIYENKFMLYAIQIHGQIKIFLYFG